MTPQPVRVPLLERIREEIAAKRDALREEIHSFNDALDALDQVQPPRRRPGRPRKNDPKEGTP